MTDRSQNKPITRLRRKSFAKSIERLRQIQLIHLKALKTASTDHTAPYRTLRGRLQKLETNICQVQRTKAKLRSSDAEFCYVSRTSFGSGTERSELVKESSVPKWCRRGRGLTTTSENSIHDGHLLHAETEW